MSSKDIDAKIANKEAEYGNLSRATAILIENHDKARDEFEAEMKERAERAEANLDKSLAKKKKELADATKLHEKVVEKHEKELTELANSVDSNNSKLESIKREKSSLESVIAELSLQKIGLESDIKVKKDEQTHLITEIDRRRTELTELEQRKAKQLVEIDELQATIDQDTLEFTAEKAARGEQIRVDTNKLSTLRSQLNESQAKLVETQQQEESIRHDLSDRAMRLDTQERNIEERENKVRLDEKRVYNYNKFTKL